MVKIYEKLLYLNESLIISSKRKCFEGGSDTSITLHMF